MIHMAERDAPRSVPHVSRLSAERTNEAAEVLAEAFRHYPVMRYVLGAGGPEPEGRDHSLIRYFVKVRFLRDEPVLGILDDDRLVAAAIVTLPGDRPYPPEVSVLREDLWGELGPEARRRYETFGDAVGQFLPDEPHCHLNMIGVRDSHQGRGLARVLMDHVHELSRSDPASSGVTLSTETQENVRLYEHFGYRLLGHTAVSGDLKTWVFFRPDDPEVI